MKLDVKHQLSGGNPKVTRLRKASFQQPMGKDTLRRVSLAAIKDKRMRTSGARNKENEGLMLVCLPSVVIRAIRDQCSGAACLRARSLQCSRLRHTLREGRAISAITHSSQARVGCGGEARFSVSFSDLPGLQLSRTALVAQARQNANGTRSCAPP
jgi:hypothetical protein